MAAVEKEMVDADGDAIRGRACSWSGHQRRVVLDEHVHLCRRRLLRHLGLPPASIVYTTMRPKSPLWRRHRGSWALDDFRRTAATTSVARPLTSFVTLAEGATDLEPSGQTYLMCHSDSVSLHQ
jgi:hypothetical protein